MADYSPVIGLEIHAELTTDSKLFCRCPNTSSQLNTPPNTAVCPVCLGLPGALPVLNKKAVESTIALGQQLECNIAPTTKWDRKNYFYPDLPKGYQISQYDEPLCASGQLRWFDTATGAACQVALTRIHLEEDTGKLTHLEGVNYSLIDYNRSSIPLLELVTEPVITSAQEAKACAEEYQRVLRELAVAEASMEKGQMRCEANISVIPKEYAQDPKKRLSGTKIEVKNLNSFRSLERAIVYEINRQSQALENGETLHQETRGWNESKGETYSMRAKETADDYRYFPEPDLSRLNLGKSLEINVSEKVSVGDKARIQISRSRLFELLLEHNLPAKEITISTNDPERLALWQKLMEQGLKPEQFALALQWINQEPAITKFSAPEITAALTDLANKKYAGAVFKEALLTAAPNQLEGAIKKIQESQKIDNLDGVVQKIVAANPKAVEEYKAGKTQLMGFFIGQVRKELGGKGDPVAIGNAVQAAIK